MSKKFFIDERGAITPVDSKLGVVVDPIRVVPGVLNVVVLCEVCRKVIQIADPKIEVSATSVGEDRMFFYFAIECPRCKSDIILYDDTPSE